MIRRDDLGIHSLGNGKFCAYGRGVDLIQLFGPPYSAPGLGAISVVEKPNTVFLSQRERGTAIWNHTSQDLHLLDFVPAKMACLARRIQNQAVSEFHLKTNPGTKICYRTGSDSLTCEIPAGTFFYAHYPFPRPVFYRIGWRGPVIARQEDDTTVRFLTNPGESWIFICGGPEYPQAVETCEAALAYNGEALLAQTRQGWSPQSTILKTWQERLSHELPMRTELLQAIDDVASLIRTQQSTEGGVLAGHNYHMCYVRDQYGVSRGLLALGQLSQAKAIMEYYWRIWQQQGRICNAQAAGVDGIFHIHENDDVEITGYLIQQAFDLEDAGANGLVDQVFPMLHWAWESQKKHLISGMLPFNGDETYVAGGILPRTTLNDGSAEATLLFLQSGERLTRWAAERKKWPEDVVSTAYQVLAKVRSAFRPNFWRDGQLQTNNPGRTQFHEAKPRFRHGVCERCHAEGRLQAIGWTERSANGRYLCSACLAIDDYTTYTPRTYNLQSVSLTPLYLHSDLFCKDELSPAVDAIYQDFMKTGIMPSCAGDGRGLTVGYDYAFLLYALNQLGHPGAQHLYRQILNLADSTGAWVEYYLEGKPQGTRCRPWESGITIEALLSYASEIKTT